MIYIYLSVCPFLRRGYRSQFWGDFNAYWLKRRHNKASGLTATDMHAGKCDQKRDKKPNNSVLRQLRFNDNSSEYDDVYYD